MVQFHIYPGGKRRIVTFSYDDGNPKDAQLIELFNAYGVKSTFHLNGKNYLSATEEEMETLRSLYAGHEISCHTLNHGFPTRMPDQSVVSEVLEDRKVLEKIAQYPVIGMSYPCGDYDDGVIAAMQSCGIVYSRTTESTKRFPLPKDFMRWHPTCHHRDALPLCEQFLENLDSQWSNPLLYIWGHSYELRTEEDWAYMEQILKTISNNDKIWYATNLEIYNYMAAQKRLQISVDERVFYNPSDITVWVERNKTDIIEIPAGKTVIA